MLEVGTKVKVIDGRAADTPNNLEGVIVRVDSADALLPYFVDFVGFESRWFKIHEIKSIESAPDTYYIAWTGTKIPAKTEEDGRVILEAIRYTDASAKLHRVSDTIIS